MAAVTGPSTHEQEAGPPPVIRSRDAVNTRQLLLRAARRRFARDGYSATTVRDIASEAGVNVALINRYFTSKEGLFEACLTQAAEVLHRPDDQRLTVEWILQSVVEQVADAPNGDQSLQLLLLLRSSGDERAERIRRGTLQLFAERMAAAAGWERDVQGSERLLLRAQIVLSTAMGIVLLRSSTGLEPLTSAGEQDLIGPLGELLAAMLLPSTDIPRS